MSTGYFDESQYYQDLGGGTPENWDEQGADDAMYNGPTPAQAQAQAQAAIAQQQQGQAPGQVQQPGQGQVSPEVAALAAQVNQLTQMFQHVLGGGQAPGQAQQQQAAQQQGLQFNPEAQATGQDLAAMYDHLNQQFQGAQQQIQQQAQQQLGQAKMAMSRQMMIGSVGQEAYQAAMQKLADPAVAPYVNWEAISAADAPAFAAFQLAQMIGSPQQQQAQVQQQAVQAAAALAPQVTPQGPQGPKTVNTVPNAGGPAFRPGGPAAQQQQNRVVDFANAKPRQLAKLSPEAQADAYLKALQGGG